MIDWITLVDEMVPVAIPFAGTFFTIWLCWYLFKKLIS